MLEVLMFVVNALRWLIIIDAVLSWVMPVDKFPRSWTTQITEPLYAPFRTLLKPERTGGFDVSPLVVLFLLWLVQQLVYRAQAGAL